RTSARTSSSATRCCSSRSRRGARRCRGSPSRRGPRARSRLSSRCSPTTTRAAHSPTRCSRARSCRSGAYRARVRRAVATDRSIGSAASRGSVLLVEQQHERAVIVVGSATVDVTAFADRMPARGETILGTSFSLALGGKGANQAVATARAGARAFFAACVGDDPFAGIVRAGLAEAGVDPRFVREVAGVGTGVAHVRVDGAGDNDIVMIPRANAAMGVDDVDRAIDEQGRPGGVLLTQLETPFDVAIHATARAHACGMTVILDPAPAAPLPDGIWESIDVVTPNETEASAFTGREVVDRASAVKAGRWFVDRGVRTALIT